MQPSNTTETASAIDDEAAKWAARRELGDWSDADQQALDAWCASDVRRFGAFVRACAISQALDHAADDIEMKAEPRLMRWLGAAAALAASLFLAMAVWPDFSTKAVPVRAILAERGDLHATGLEDGTGVTLNTDSEIKVRFDQHMRSVEIVKGEALFDVRKDPARPFIVRAGSMQVQAVGTSFAVRRYKDETFGLWVREGVVSLNPKAPLNRDGGGTLTYGAGHFVRSDATGRITDVTLKSDQLDRALSWRNGLINLEGMTLAEAVAEYERYSARRIVFTDSALGGLRLSGLFSSRDPEAFCKAAALAFGLMLTVGPTEIRISPQPNKNK
jgi:transmembrane sensor